MNTPADQPDPDPGPAARSPGSPASRKGADAATAGQIWGLQTALRACVGCMEMQIARERGEMHLSQPAMKELWDGAVTNANALLAGGPPAIPDDVARLVVAARIVAFEDQSADALRELDQASEAFASRVPWEDEPEAEGSASRLREGDEGAERAAGSEAPGPHHD